MKKIIREELAIALDLTGEINYIIGVLEEYKTQFPEWTLTIEEGRSWDDNEFNLIGSRLETDEEYEQRTARKAKKILLKQEKLEKRIKELEGDLARLKGKPANKCRYGSDPTISLCGHCDCND
jgi:hypothetical protein